VRIAGRAFEGRPAEPVRSSIISFAAFAAGDYGIAAKQLATIDF
jgi:hypothetical protein